LTLIQKKPDDLNYNLYNVKPNLQTQKDIDYLWKHIDAIDCIATDHAPHLLEEKKKENCYGFTGLETFLPVMLRQVQLGKMSLEKLVEMTYSNPLKILGIHTNTDSMKKLGTVLNDTLIIQHPCHKRSSTGPYKGNTFSKSKWSPFNGVDVKLNSIMKQSF